MCYSFDDNYTTDFVFDCQRRMMAFSFDYYFDNNQKKRVLNPCRFVVKNWSSIQVDEESYNMELNSSAVKNKYSWKAEYGASNLEDSVVMAQLALILEMRQEGNSLFIWTMSYDNKYFNIKITDADISLELTDMTKNINMYKSVDEINNLPQKDIFIARIASVNNKTELLLQLKMHLHIPSHIKCNWDVLSELLYEPFWLSKWKSIAIIHDDISNLSKSDLEIYKNVITYCKLHTLHTYFVFNDKDFSSITN